MFGNQNKGGFSFGSTQSGTNPGGSAFGAATSSTAPSAGFSFAGATPATATQAPSSSFSFGTTQLSTAAAPSAAGGFSFGGGATSTAVPSAATSGFTFGAKPAGGLGATQAATTGQSTGFAFGGQTAAASTVPKGGLSFGTAATTTAPSTGSTGFSFAGVKPTAAAAPSMGGFAFSSPAASAAPASTGFSLGGTKTTSSGGITLGGTAASTTPLLSNLVSSATTSTTTSLPTLGTPSLLGSTTQPSTGSLGLGTTTVPPTGGLSLGTTTQPSSGLTLGSAAKTTGGLTLGTATQPGSGLTLGSTTGSTLGIGGFKPAASSTTTTSTAAAVPLSSGTATTASTQQMTYKQLEEQINKCAAELEDYERTFLDQAGQVNTWDRLLMENGEKITELNANVESVKAEQKRLDEELDFIMAQQQELEVLLNPLEEELKKRTAGSGQQQHADKEREFTYGLAKDIDGQLKQMVGDLKAIIDHLNAAGTTQQENNDPIVQVAKILNAHMNSLQWVDQNAALLQRKVDEVSSLSDIRRKEQERNFRLAFD